MTLARTAWVLLTLATAACSGALASEELLELGVHESALGESCSTDNQCGVAGVVCAPAGICVRPSNCVAGATGAGIFAGNLVVDGTDTMADLASLGNAWCVTGNLSVKQTALGNLSGLSSLVAVGNTLSIEDNAALPSLQGLENLRRVFKLSLFRNATLGSLGALSRLTSASSLQIYQHPALVSLDGLQGITLLSGAEVVNNVGLTSLSGLHAVTRFASYLDLRQNPGLTSLSGLEALASVGNLLQITDNPNLSGFSGLGNLATIGNTLRVMRNAELTNLDALAALSSARTFQVSDNVQLDSCNVSEIAARVAADCTGCVRNGPCLPDDHCPSDPDKLEPGACGCGVPDADSDGDGAADCVDVCPQDNPDDIDLDGVCNGADLCPGFDDAVDVDENGIPDGCQECVTAADCAEGTCSETGECIPPACAFVPLGYLPAVSPNSAAFAVSDDGLTVTGRTHISNGNYRAFRWRQSTGMVGLHPSPTSAGRAISADGGRIAGIGGSQLAASNQFAFREDDVFISTLPSSSGIFGLSADGSVAVGQQNGSAIRWLAGHGSAEFLPFGAGLAQANGISADGSVIVGRGAVSSTGLEAFVWTASGSIGLGDFGTPFASSEANAVSPNGQVVVGTAAFPGDSRHGFIWTASTGLVSLGGSFIPYAVTNSGMVVGDWAGQPHVFDSALGDGPIEVLVESCGVDLGSWRISEIRDVTPDGSTIVGTGRNPAERYEAILIRIPPLP